MAGKKRVGSVKGRAKKPPAAPVYGSKTAAIGGMPSELSAKEIVARAKTQGMTLSEAYVHKIRSSHKAKSSPVKRIPDSARAAQKSPVDAGMGQTAADFVRSMPAGVSAKEAVRRARKAGISLTPGYYYVLRSTLGLARARAGRAAPSSEPASASFKLASADRHEQAVIEAVAALGVERVRYVLEAVRRLRG